MDLTAESGSAGYYKYDFNNHRLVHFRRCSDYFHNDDNSVKLLTFILAPHGSTNESKYSFCLSASSSRRRERV